MSVIISVNFSSFLHNLIAALLNIWSTTSLKFVCNISKIKPNGFLGTWQVNNPRRGLLCQQTAILWVIPSVLQVGDETYFCRDGREKPRVRTEKPKGPSVILGQDHLPLPLHHLSTILYTILYITILPHVEQLLTPRSFWI